METLLTIAHITTAHNAEQTALHIRYLPLQMHICGGCLKWAMMPLPKVMCLLLRQRYRAATR